MPALAASAVPVVVVGASAGGLSPLAEILRALPATFPAPIALVQHIPPHPRSHMVEALTPMTRLAVFEARDKEPLRAGTLHVAPPGYHLLIESDRSFALSVDPPVHFSRPSVDVLFESAADALGARVVAIVLSGANADGSNGVRRVRACGGHTVAQTPSSCGQPEMPMSAIRTGCVDRVLPPAAIGARLAAIAVPAAAPR